MVVVGQKQGYTDKSTIQAHGSYVENGRRR
jgi:hypothetical protein